MHRADIGIGKTTEKTEINDFKLTDKYFLQLDNSLGTRNCVDSWLTRQLDLDGAKQPARQAQLSHRVDNCHHSCGTL